MSVSPIFYVCGDTARNPGRSGIQTVVRSLAAAFGAMHAPVRPVVWQRSAAQLRPLPPNFSLGLGAEPLRDGPLQFSKLRRPTDWAWTLLTGAQGRKLPLHRHPHHRDAPPGTWVLVPELMYRDVARQLTAYVHRRGWRLAVIFYDAIPVRFPELVPPALPASHAEYMRGIISADLILPISETSAQDFRDFASREGLPSPPVQTCALACDLPGVPRVREVPPVPPPATRLPPPAAPIRLLCVSTVEPRKNHRTLLAAFALATRRRPDLPLQLDLVGAPYAGAPDLADLVRAACARPLPGGLHQRLRWHERVEHAALGRFYAGCDFTVYPSVLEGFGLPVIESLWFARPCVCADFGVMAENAAGGGCLTCDVRDPEALADAMIRLAENPALRRELVLQATTRPLKTWAEYAQEILEALHASL